MLPIEGCENVREKCMVLARFLGHYTMLTFAIDAIFTPILSLLLLLLVLLLILLLILAPIAAIRTRKIAKSFQFQHEFFKHKIHVYCTFSLFCHFFFFFFFVFSSFQPVINEQISCMLDKFLPFHWMNTSGAAHHISWDLGVEYMYECACLRIANLRMNTFKYIQ